MADTLTPPPAHVAHLQTVDFLSAEESEVLHCSFDGRHGKFKSGVNPENNSPARTCWSMLPKQGSPQWSNLRKSATDGNAQSTTVQSMANHQSHTAGARRPDGGENSSGAAWRKSSRHSSVGRSVGRAMPLSPPYITRRSRCPSIMYKREREGGRMAYPGKGRKERRK